MKAFTIFPAISVFFLVFTLLTLEGQIKSKMILFWTVFVTITFCVFALRFSSDIFIILLYMNFLGVLICIPCLTYLTNSVLKRKSDYKIYWLRILSLGIVSTLLTITVAGICIWLALLYNPTDPST